MKRPEVKLLASEDCWRNEEKTTIAIRYRSFELSVLSFDQHWTILCNLINGVLYVLLDKFVILFYFIIIHSCSLKNNIVHLKAVFQMQRVYKLKKSVNSNGKISFWGHLFLNGYNQTDRKKVDFTKQKSWIMIVLKFSKLLLIKIYSKVLTLSG